MLPPVEPRIETTLRHRLNPYLLGMQTLSTRHIRAKCMNSSALKQFPLPIELQGQGLQDEIKVDLARYLKQSAKVCAIHFHGDAIDVMLFNLPLKSRTAEPKNVRDG